MMYQFDEFELDTENYVITRSQTQVHVEPLVFDLLHYFAKNSGRVITREEIIEHIWQGRFVSDATVASCIKSARKALGDSGENQKYIQTIRGRGMQFLPAVSEIGNDSSTHRTDNQINSSDYQPSLMVLPFQTFVASDDLTPLADSIVENLTTILTRIPFVSIASRSSSFSLKGMTIDAQEVGRRFDVRYMLEGSLQSVDGKIIANVQLIETKSGFHIWAQQFECPDSPNPKDAILGAVLPRLEMHLIKVMYNDLRSESGEMSGGQLLLEAMGLLSLKGWHQNTFQEATDLLRKAIKLEPDLALAHAYLAIILGLGHRVGLLEHTDEVANQALSAADQALDLDDSDSLVVGLSGCAIADAGQPERAVSLLKKSLELNPNNGHAWTALGSAYALMKKFPEALEPLQRGIEISPMDNRLAVWRAILALVYLNIGKPDEAVETAEHGCQNDDKNYLPKLVLTAIYLARQEQSEALRSFKECLRVKPDLSEHETMSMVGRTFGDAIAKMREELKC